ncbi:MAG: hypothetical protein WC773_04610 [Patescibacteria group bacterium]
MQHIKQQTPYDCKLAVIAMLRDLPLFYVEQIVCSLLGIKKWSEAVFSPPLFYRGIELLYNRFNLTGLMITLQDINDRFSATPLNCLPDNLSNKGEIIVYRLTSSCGHAVAFENNMIYDPADYWPMSKEQWFDNHKHHQPFQLIPFELKQLSNML